MRSLPAPRPAWAVLSLLIVLTFHVSAQDATSAADSINAVRPERDVLLTTHATTLTDSAGHKVGISWSVTTFERSTLTQHPARTLEGLITLAAGVSSAANQPRVGMMAGQMYPSLRGLSASYSDLHVRGSREGETEYRFGGISSVDRWSNTNVVPYLPEMLERVTVHTGAYGPDLGSMGGGVVEMSLREGGEAFAISSSFHTDDVAKPGETVLNTSSYGWKTAVVTMGTPLPFDMKLFVAGEISRKADRAPMYLEPMDVMLAPDTYTWNSAYYDTVPGPFVVERNRAPFQSEERNVVQWNLTGQPAGIDVAFFGSHASGRKRDVTWPTAVTNMYRLARLPWAEETATFAAVRAGGSLGERFTVRSTLAYSGTRSNTSDPDMGESWRNYPDSAGNAAIGYGGFLRRYTGPRSISAIASFIMSGANSPNNTYRKESATALTWSARVDAALSETWRASVQAEAEWWTLRRFSVGNISNGLRYMDWNQDGIVDQTFSNDLERWVYTKSAWFIDNFGYDIAGNMADDGLDGPQRPSYVSLSANSTWRDGPMSIDAGARLVRLSMDMPTVPKQRNPITGSDDWQNLDAIWNYSYEVFHPGVLYPSEVETYLLPRVSLQRATSSGRLYASYGAFVEPASQYFLQMDDRRLADILDPLGRVGYNLGGNAVTFPLKAARTNQYEIGAEHQWHPAVTASLVIYRKDLVRQAQLERLNSTTNYPYFVGYGNSGESSVTGIEAGLSIVPWSGVECGLTYAWASMKGFGSHARSNQRYVTDDSYWIDEPEANVLRPLAYERSHRFVGVLDLRPTQGPLNGLRVLTTVRLESGTPYTLLNPLRFIGGSSTLWNIGARHVRDPRSIDPAEPFNASRTPWTSLIDVAVSYELRLGPTTVLVYALVTNLFDSKNVINVFPASGTPTEDTWLQSPYSASYASIPQYESFYRLLNLKNRWAYMDATGNDLYGAPRQIQVGARVGI